jgi:hypothetical protein
MSVVQKIIVTNGAQRGEKGGEELGEDRRKLEPAVTSSRDDVILGQPLWALVSMRSERDKRTRVKMGELSIPAN